MQETNVAIEFQNVFKSFSYQSGKTPDLKTSLIQTLKGRSVSQKTEVSVLEGVSFRINKGEFVGVMGRNGAGKSTMLKMMCGIYSPTSGEIKIHGKIAPLLELGAGFQQDLSGYENISLNASVLGFSRKETLKSVAEIIEFSELGEKIDLPVRNYSSGMLVRLGFSIASHLPSPIILLDEVLSVGDQGFQKKCIAKIQELHASGRTIILVSHSPVQIKQHCSRCIVIENKKKVYDGNTVGGTECYLAAFL